MNRALLDKFYRGECSPEEVRQVVAWFRTNELSPEQEPDFRALWEEAGQHPPDAHDADRLFRQIADQLPPPGEKRMSGKRRRLPAPAVWWKVAAVLVPLCVLGALVLWQPWRNPADVAYRSAATAPGERKTVHLPDGSVVFLHGNSRITYPETFTTGTRAIELQGEAFFEVAKDSLHPFVVQSGAIATRALGTSFNIRYRPNDGLTTVALATGVVQIEADASGTAQPLTRLVPGQQLAFQREAQRYAVSPFDAREVLGWMDGVLYFRNAGRAQVLRKLEDWYGVEIDVASADQAHEDWNYTGEYTHETLDKVLEGIGFVKGFTFERTGHHIQLIFHPSQHAMPQNPD
ncbi:ferric-dicitrate binding protein FerR, regulates iron transport through sigma-19 [Catalinimonas alkaloidigena]|uniref:Ferric-dicitrate binding protein FerR, regulates iron transport through sigma-19 n=1 Tax=Catalinimonas alkaloidigena TaxID=1075417 RepID=A0A1G9P304_9BACT|nr:FecR family protein [Catalinimonas alkaloidigena]SDL93039.1 ferric-dicitrate binding protein FerR, regulates iron transport through sigma-19 [Catalinimonas alkaloidigena]